MKKNLSKDTLLPWILSQLYNKDLQEADSSARQLWELHTHQTTNLGSNHHLQGYFKKDLLKICNLFIIYSLGMAKGSLLPQMRTHQASKQYEKEKKKTKPKKHKHKKKTQQKPQPLPDLQT